MGWFDVDMESMDNYNIKENSYALGILGTYKTSSMTNYRVRINYTKIGIKEYHDQYYVGIRNNESVTGSQNKVTIAPGVSWNLSKEKLDVYFGIEIPFTLHRKFDVDYKSVQTDSASGAQITYMYIKNEIPNGYSVGVGGIFGFNYFLSSKLSLGAEFSPSLLYSNLGGNVKVKASSTQSPQTAVGISEDNFRGFTHYENRFSFGISLWL